MKTGLHILLILFFSAQLALGQENQITPYFVKSRNFDISFQDTVINTSILTLPTGKFQFVYGNDHLTEEFVFLRFTGKGKNSRTTKDSLIKSDKPGLRIDSYFPMLHQDSTKVLIAPDYAVIWSPHHQHEFWYTYVLNQSGHEPLIHSKKDSIIRITFEELGVNHAQYEIFTIDLSGDEFLFHRKKVKHTYSETFETLEEVKGTVKNNKAIKRFYEELKKYDFSDSTYFVKYDGSIHALIEFKTYDHYSAILRPHVNDRGRITDKALTWNMYDLLGWTLRNNQKEEKRKRKEQKRNK